MDTHQNRSGCFQLRPSSASSQIKWRKKWRHLTQTFSFCSERVTKILSDLFGNLQSSKVYDKPKWFEIHSWQVLRKMVWNYFYLQTSGQLLVSWNQQLLQVMHHVKYVPWAAESDWDFWVCAQAVLMITYLPAMRFQCFWALRHLLKTRSSCWTAFLKWGQPLASWQISNEKLCLASQWTAGGC